MNNIKIVLVIICILLTLSALVSCTPKKEALTEDLESAVKKETSTEEIIDRMIDSVKKKWDTEGDDNFLVFGPLDILDEKIVICVVRGYTADVRDVTIASSVFSFPSLTNIYVYHESDFITLQDAYTINLITSEEVEAIHSQYMFQRGKEEYILCKSRHYY